MPNYDCLISDRDGRSTSKEQIGVLTKLNTRKAISTLQDPEDVWERSPVLFNQEINGVKWYFYINHLKPDDVKAEMFALDQEVEHDVDKPIVIIGDLNADCRYYDSVKEDELDDWWWLIKHTEDTTSGKTDCAYDRILMNVEAEKYYLGHGIHPVPQEMSDHYLIWVGIGDEAMEINKYD